VVSISVVAGQFISALHVAQHVEQNGFSDDAHAGIRRTGVIHVAQFVTAARGIDRGTMVKLDNAYSAAPLSPPARFP
jgi:hypothetical protein